MIFSSIAHGDYVFCIGYFVLAALALRHTKVGDKICYSAKMLRVATSLAGLVILVYLAEIIIYGFYPNFGDHSEPTVASIAWLGLHGKAYYPDLDKGNLYGLVYGPLLYFINSIFLSISPTLTAVKLAGIVPLLLALGIMFSTVRQRTNDFLVSLFIVASLVSVFEHYGLEVYWNRAEPYLILIAVLALFAATRLRPITAAVVIGSLAGVAAGFKINGFLYVLPMATMLLAGAKRPREFTILSAIGIGCAAIFMSAPFWAHPSSVYDYFQYLKLAGHEGLSFELFIKNCIFAIAIFAPVAFVLYWRRPALGLRERWLIAGLTLSLAITVVIAAKPGSGTHIFIPFIPLCLYATAVLLDADSTKASGIAALVFLLTFIAYFPSFAFQIAWSKGLLANAQFERVKAGEIRELLDAYPDAQIGVSDQEHYIDTHYSKFLSVLKGHSIRVDFTAWMDLQLGGVQESNITRLVQRDSNGCNVPTWILPLGAPFTMVSRYTMRPEVSDEFRRTFYENYKLVHMSRAFQVWVCKLSNM